MKISSMKDYANSRLKLKRTEIWAFCLHKFESYLKVKVCLLKARTLFTEGKGFFALSWFKLFGDVLLIAREKSWFGKFFRLSIAIQPSFGEVSLVFYSSRVNFTNLQKRKKSNANEKDREEEGTEKTGKIKQRPSSSLPGFPSCTKVKYLPS